MPNRWNPHRELAHIRQDMNRLYWERYGKPGGKDASDEVMVDLYETGNHIIVAAALPGVKLEDIEVTLTGSRLNIRGEFPLEPEEQNAEVHFVELPHGRFLRTINLPGAVDTEEIGASFSDGILKITLPKLEKDQPKQIPVKLQQG